MKTNATDTTTSCPCRRSVELPSPPLSGRDAALHSILSELPKHANFEEQIVALIAVLDGMMGEMLSPDAFYLAMMKAIDSCDKLKVPTEVSTGVIEAVTKHWTRRRSQNPLSGMF